MLRDIFGRRECLKRRPICKKGGPVRGWARGPVPLLEMCSYEVVNGGGVGEHALVRLE